MWTSLKFTGALLVTALVLGAWGLRQRTAAQAEADAGQALAEETHRVAASLARAEAELAAVRQDDARLAKELAILNAVVIKPYSLPPPAGDSTNAKAREEEQKSIEEQEESARGFRAQLAAEYAPFYTLRGLDAAQVDRLETILTDHWHRDADLKAVAEQQQLAEDDPRVKTLRAEEEAAFARAKMELLGEDGLRSLTEYERTLPVRQVTASLAGLLYYTDASLTRSQAEELTRLLAEASPPYVRGETADVAQLNWDALMPKAQTLLSAEQFSLLQTKRKASVGQSSMEGRFERIALRSGLDKIINAVKESAAPTK